MRIGHHKFKDVEVRIFSIYDKIKFKINNKKMKNKIWKVSNTPNNSWGKKKLRKIRKYFELNGNE